MLRRAKVIEKKDTIPPWSHRLIAARTLKNLNKKEFAKKIGVEPETYRRYERGETEPNFDTLIKIRNFAGISLDVLIAGETFRAGDRFGR